MRRRKSSSSVGGSLDSLLDTMTNVVGILVILLVVTQLGVGEAVKRITGLVTAEELEAARAESDELAKLLDEHETELADLDLSEEEVEAELARQDALIEELRAGLQKLAEADVDPEEVAKQNAERRKREEELIAAIDERTKRIETLKALLADTPERGPDPDAKIVNLPNPREAPKGAEAVEFLVKRDRVLPIATEELQQRAQAAIQQALRGLVNPEDNRLDADKLKQFFEDRVIGDRYFRLKIQIVNGRPELVLEPKEGAGISTRNLRSGFGRTLARYRNRNVFLRFRVYADSFEAYLAAREAADRVDVPAGWLPYSANADYRISLGTEKPVLVSGYEPPPPRKPSPNPQPKRPPPPKSDID